MSGGNYTEHLWDDVKAEEKYWCDWIDKNVKGVSEKEKVDLQKAYEDLRKKYPDGIPPEVFNAVKLDLHAFKLAYGFAKEK